MHCLYQILNFKFQIAPRFLGVLEKKFSAFVWCKIEMASLLDLAIPKHRIEYFNYHGELVWSKKGRIDKVFGSSNSGGETIYDVIQRHADAVRKEKDCPELIVNEQESSEIRPSCKSKPRPTHFICIPISDPAVRARLHELQTQVCAKDSRLEQACIPVAALHITLLMLRCPNPEALAKAKSIFEEFRPLLNLYVPMSTSISLKGVNTFDGRVMYAQPIEVGRLRCLVDAMAAKFTAAGVRLLGNRTPYQPHVTLFKLSRAMSADAGVGRMDYTLYGKFSDKWIGEQAVNSLNFCELYGVKDRYTGFYVSISSIANSCSIAGASSVINVGSSINVKQLMEVIFSDSNAIQRVVVLRGLPGFGKSELARAIVVASNEYGGAVIASADDCMAAAVDKCGRTFDPTLLPLVHQSCYERAAASLSNGVPLVIIDNTNTQLKEYIVYEELAKKRMASFHVIEVDHAVQNCATGTLYTEAACLQLSSFIILNLPISFCKNCRTCHIICQSDTRCIVITECSCSTD